MSHLNELKLLIEANTIFKLGMHNEVGRFLKYFKLFAQMNESHFKYMFFIASVQLYEGFSM